MIQYIILIVVTAALKVRDCALPVAPMRLFNQDGVSPPESTQGTLFSVCKSNGKLIVDFHNYDIFIYNPLTKCNDKLFNYDVNEIFIGNKQKYLEIEVSPSGVAFVAEITNLNSDCTALQTKYQQCNLITYSAKLEDETDWSTHIEIPINLFEQPIYANFFRVDKLATTTQYSSYVPTFANPACFHHPDVFIELEV